MQSSPNSALLAFPLEEGSEAYKPFMMWWLNYCNVVVKQSDDFPKAEQLFSKSFWDIEKGQECLFLSTPLLQILNLTKSKRLYFIGKNLTGKIETNIRVASSLQLDPVLVWNPGAFGEISDVDTARLKQYCEIVETADLVAGFNHGRVDFQNPPKDFEKTSE